MFMAVDMVIPIDLKVSSADAFKSSSILKLICAIVFFPLNAMYYTTFAFQRQAQQRKMQHKPYYQMAYTVICALKVIIDIVKKMRFVGTAPMNV